MELAATLIVLVLPGVLASVLHAKLTHKSSAMIRLAAFGVYTVVIDAVLCIVKMMHGAELVNFQNWFAPPLSFVFYMTIAFSGAVALPLLFAWIRDQRWPLAVKEKTLTQKETQPKKTYDFKHLPHSLLRIAIILISGILIGAILVIAVYALPLDAIEENVLSSAATIEEEGSYPFLYSNWRSTRLDNFTDSIMLLMAAYDGDQGVVQNAMLSTYTRFTDHDPAEGLVKLATGDETGMHTHSYSRYWHGYLVWLKPLLMFFDYSQIRVINTVLQIILMLATAAVMFKKQAKRLIVPFFVMIWFLTPNAVFLSFQFSWVLYVFIVSSIVLMLRFEKLMQKQSFYVLFLITGMATSYVDFLTYPLISLGIPLAIYVYLRKRRTMKEAITDIIVLSMVWGIGYVGMWAGKWLLCTLLTDNNVLQSVQENITARMSFAYDEEVFTIVGVIKRNIESYNHWTYMGPFLLSLLLYAIWNRSKYASLTGRRLSVSVSWLSAELIPMLVISCIPIAWFFVASNHTYIHYWFAHRTLAISVFAVLTAFAGHCQIDNER